MHHAYEILVVIAVAIWVPALTHFFRAWKIRKNPISLAICATISLVIWEAVSHIWLLHNGIDPLIEKVVYLALMILTGAYVDFSFYWANERFKGKHGAKNGDMRNQRANPEP